MPAPLYLAGDTLDLSPLEYDKRPDRYIEEADGGKIVAQVVVDESGSDELMITEHPVQQGAVIADHAVKRPAEVRIRLGWTDAYLADFGMDGVNPGGVVRDVYDKILRLQAGRIRFTVYTGKRAYPNMLVSSVQVHNDARMEFTFLADVAFREVILVNTKVQGGGVLSTGLLAVPEKNAPTTENGEKQAAPAEVPNNYFESGASIENISPPSEQPPEPEQPPSVRL